MDVSIDGALWDDILTVYGRDRADKCLDYSWQEFKKSNYDFGQILAECALDIYMNQLGGIDAGKIITSFYAISSCLVHKGSSREAADLLISMCEFTRDVSETEYFESLEWATRLYVDAHEFELAVKATNRLIGDPLLILNGDAIYELLNTQAKCLHRLGRTEQAISSYKEAINLLPKDELERKSLIYEEISVCYANLDMGPDSLNYARRALDFALITNDRSRLENSHYAMALAKKTLGDHKSSLAHFLRCKEIIHKNVSLNVQFLIKIEEQIAHIYFETGKLKEAEVIKKRIANLISIEGSKE